MNTILTNKHFLRGSIALSMFVPSLAGAESTDTSCGSITGSTNPLKDGADCSQANGVASNLTGHSGLFQTISNTLIYIVGAIAVIMLIIGGLRYVISQGDKSNVESAKNTILYAVIGIVVAVLAYAIVNFVATALTNSSASGA